MGKLSNDPVINHFSHHHPLHLSTCQQTQITPSSCSGCNQTLSGWIYTCKPCNYSLHLSCSQVPHLINHPSHPNHPLPLLPYPAYPQGYFNCDACGRQGTGFSYHCGTCDVDLHIVCASMPLSLYHQAHHHPLNLTFFPPYQNKGFSCDICRGMGGNHWLYRCNMCEFDAHLGCANGANMGLVQAPAHVQQHQMLQRGVSSTTPPQFQASRGGYMNGIQQNYTPNYSVNRPTSQPTGIGNVAIQGLVDGFAQQIGQSLVQSLIGGGGGGGGGAGGGGGTDAGGGVGADAGGGGAEYSSDAGVGNGEY